MKKALLLTVALSMIFVAGSAFGQAGLIQPYSDTALSNCNAVAPSGLFVVHIVHELTPGATASEWAVQDNSGGALSWVADTPLNGFLTIGDSQSDLAVAYGACLAGPIAIVDIKYFVLANPAACSSLQIVPGNIAGSGQIEGVDCAVNPHSTFPTGGRLTFNDDGTCPCQTVPVQETNWGQIKALYN